MATKSLGVTSRKHTLSIKTMMEVISLWRFYPEIGGGSDRRGGDKKRLTRDLKTRRLYSSGKQDEGRDSVREETRGT